MNTRRGRGFTLIELLVVIAIIGVLSAVVLASLSTARQKGSDAAAKGDLIGMHAQGELFYYGNGNSYSNVCGAAASVPGGVKSINQQVVAAAQAEGLSSVTIVYGTPGTNTTATCHDSATGWGAEVPLKLPAGYMFCVDSTGNATTTMGFTIGANDVVCG